MIAREISYPLDPLAQQGAVLVHGELFHDDRDPETLLDIMTIRSANKFNYCVEDKSELIAAGSLVMRPGEGGKAEVTSVVVKTEYRGLGVGRLLMEHIQSEAVDLRASCLRVASTKTAIGFYEKLGFQVEDPQVSPSVMIKHLY